MAGGTEFCLLGPLIVRIRGVPVAVRDLGGLSWIASHQQGRA
jgi:hypothetical protein